MYLTQNHPWMWVGGNTYIHPILASLGDSGQLVANSGNAAARTCHHRFVIVLLLAFPFVPV